MTRPTVRINTFVETSPKHTRPSVDLLSKIYIIGGLPTGVNRLPVITRRRIFTIPSQICVLFSIISTLYTNVSRDIEMLFYVFFSYISIAHVCCLLLNVICNKRMRRYYNEISKFDMEFGCRPKTQRLSIIFYIQMCIVMASFLVLFILPIGTLHLPGYAFQVIPVHIVYISELHYYGHIVSLLTPRLRLINYYMQMAVCHAGTVKTRITKKYVFFKNYNENANCQMKKIMDAYYIVYQSYNYLIEAIKWQMLIIIFTSFGAVLSSCYHFSLKIIGGERTLNNVILDMGFTLVTMVPLFAPCVAGDQVHAEVRHLRELLASRLYANQLDKSGRSVARALLEFTENRDLSFRLLRILDVDISLPFKFVGLIVTYLIILLQFDKVINAQNL